jgi:hypothetical protein
VIYGEREDKVSLCESSRIKYPLRVVQNDIPVEAKEHMGDNESLPSNVQKGMSVPFRELGTRQERNTMTTETKCLHHYEYDAEKKAFFCVYCGQPMPPQVLEVPF